MINFFGVIFVVTRNAAGSWDDENGKYIPGDESQFNAKMTVRAANEREALPVPEAFRTRGPVLVHSDTMLQMPDEVGQYVGDRFSWSGREYRVMFVDDRSKGILQFCRAIAVLEEANKEQA